MRKGMNYRGKYLYAALPGRSARKAIEPKPCNMVNSEYAAQHCRLSNNVALSVKGTPTQPPENGNHSDCMKQQ
jgi:hypothetical protein